MNTEIITLKGDHIQLEPLMLSHQGELYEAAQDDRIWLYNANKALGEQFYSWFDKACQSLKSHEHFPFVVRRLNDQKVVGSTRYYDIAREHRRLTIGYTWYIPEVWGTYVNLESKYLLLKYAFEILKMNRVEFLTDTRNLRSQAAIKKLGAMEEGKLRQHMILEDGTSRDSLIFSITQPEWHSVELSLKTRLKQFL